MDASSEQSSFAEGIAKRGNLPKIWIPSFLLFSHFTEGLAIMFFTKREKSLKLNRSCVFKLSDRQKMPWEARELVRAGKRWVCVPCWESQEFCCSVNTFQQETPPAQVPAGVGHVVVLSQHCLHHRCRWGLLILGVPEATPDLKQQMRAAGPAQNVPPRPPHHNRQGQASWALGESRHPRTRCSRSTGSSRGWFLEWIIRIAARGCAGQEMRLALAVSPSSVGMQSQVMEPGRLSRGVAVQGRSRAVFSKARSQQRAALPLSLPATCAGAATALLPLLLTSAAHPCAGCALHLLLCPGVGTVTQLRSHLASLMVFYQRFFFFPKDIVGKNLNIDLLIDAAATTTLLFFSFSFSFQQGWLAVFQVLCGFLCTKINVVLAATWI